MKRFITLLFAVSVALIAADQPKNVQKTTAGALTEGFTSNRTHTFLTNATVTFNVGSNLQVNGVFGGSPTGGSLNLANVTVTGLSLGGAGNVTGSALTSGNIIVGAGSNAVAASAISISGANLTTTGTVTAGNITGNVVVTNGTVSNLTVGNLTGSTAAGQLLIGDGTGKFIPGNIIAGSNITVTPSSGSVTISATASSSYTFTAADFDVSGTTVSLDYVNGQMANGENSGFLSGADWITFNGKVSPTRTVNGHALSSDVTVTAADIAATGTSSYRFITDSQLLNLGNQSGTNTGDQNIFQSFAVSGQPTVTANATAQTLNIVGGANVTVTTDNTTKTITIAAAGGGGGGSGNVTGSSLTANKIVTGAGTNAIQITGVGIDSSNNIVTVGNVTAGANAASGDSSAFLATRNVSSVGPHGFRDESTFNASVGASGYGAFDANMTVSGTSAYNHIASFQHRPAYTGSTSMTELRGFWSGPSHSGTGTVTYGKQISLTSTAGTGPLTWDIGIFSDIGTTRGSNNYFLYHAGQAPSLLAGQLQMAISANTNGASNTDGHISMQGFGAASKQFNLGYNTTGNYGWMQAANFGTAYSPILINPNGGNVIIGTTDTTGLTGTNNLKVGGNFTSGGSISASNFSGSHSGTSSGTNTGDQDLSGLVPNTRTVNGHALSTNVTVTKSDVSLSNVTDDVQTKAAIVPNTAPSAGNILVGNAGGTAYAPVAMSGDATLASTGAITLGTVNSNVGTYGNATTVPAITVNAKGLVTGVSNITISGGGNVTASGTPTSGQMAQFSSATNIVGVSTTGSGNAVLATSPTITTPTLSGNVTSDGANIITASSMGALSVDVSKSLNTKTVSADSTLTFSATPSSGTWFSVLITNSDSASHVITFPSSYSMANAASVTTSSVPASGKLHLTWRYDGTTYVLYGDPVTAAGSGTVTAFSSGNLTPLFTTSVATANSTPSQSFTLTDQNANIVFAGPTTGAAAAPTFRSLVAADLPTIANAGLANSTITLGNTSMALGSTTTNVTGLNSLTFGTPAFSDTDFALQGTASVNSYYQIELINTSSGTAASTDISLHRDGATSTTNYIDLGINSSGFTGSGSLSRASAGYLYTQSDELVVGTNANKSFTVVTNGTDRLVIDGSGTATFSGAISASNHGTATAYRFIGRQIITNPTTTYTSSAGVTRILVRLIGGGGGGGGVTGTASNVGAGGGGGSGSYAEKWFTVTASTGYTVAVGAGGTAGANTGGTGGTGGATTITVSGTTVTANGGLGGVGQTAGTAAGFVAGGAGGAVSTNGDLNTAGMAGEHGYRVSGTVGRSGNGAGGLYGQGGAVGLTAAGAGNNAGNYGAGGGGGLSTAATARTGGTGSNGVIIVEEYGI